MGWLILNPLKSSKKSTKIVGYYSIFWAKKHGKMVVAIAKRVGMFHMEQFGFCGWDWLFKVGDFCYDKLAFMS